MARFLTPGWLADVAVKNAPPAGPDRVIVEQTVSDGDGQGELTYQLVVDGNQAVVVAGRVGPPDAWMRTERMTAVAVARGELTPEAALMAGKVRVGGDLAALSRLREVEGPTLPDALREATTWD